MKRDMFTDRRQCERRTRALSEDVLCRRIYGERRKIVRVATLPWWLQVDYLDKEATRPDEGT